MNKYKKRVQWLTAVRMALDAAISASERLKIVDYVTSRDRELSTITRALLASMHPLGQI